jgi:phenylacetic acid degradation operon negative regulatory protein
MQARSALFDLYGDYLRPHGGRAPVAALVKLLAPVGIAAPAVRTAVSRMVRQGWLAPVRIEREAGYHITPRAARRLDDAAGRIYRTGRSGWDGRFDLILFTQDRNAARRAQVAKLADTLAFLGYGRLDGNSWVATTPAHDVDAALGEASLPYERFAARHHGGHSGAMALVRRAWDLDALGKEYDRFTAEFKPLVTAIGARSTDEQAYAARFRLVHAWRSFLFRDPQLPPALLPERWPGTAAASFFDRHATRLRPAADRFVGQCLGTWTLTNQKGPK